jgi:hypothetical protein
VGRDYLATLIRKLVADGATRESIVRVLENKLTEAAKNGAVDSDHCHRIRRIQFYLRTRLVPRETTTAEMAILRVLQNVR